MKMRMPGRPLLGADGTPWFLMPKSVVDQDEEQWLCVWFVCQSVFFGDCYRQLMPRFFDRVGLNSGVMIATAVPSRDLLPKMSFPGDVDLLIISYIGNNLYLNRTLVVEVKIVRAKFAAQGKSPNDFGFTQAKALVSHGFPFVGVAHLIVSDASPMHAWRSMHVTEVMDARSGHVSEPRECFVDMLRGDLIKRCFGRLLKNSESNRLGLLSAYLTDNGVWHPAGRSAEKNLRWSQDTLAAIGRYYCENFWRFRDLPRYPPGFRV